MTRASAAVIGAVLLSTCLGADARADGSAKHVKVEDCGDRVAVTIGGRLFTEYWVRDVSRPYFYPVIAPTGDNVTRHWPMKEAPHEERDHPHHRGLWYAHGDVNGHDFWHKERIVHEATEAVVSGDGAGSFRARSRWETQDGQTVCTDVREFVFAGGPGCRTIELTITIHASHGPVTFGDTKEGSMAIRLAPSLRVRGEIGQGHIVNSVGLRDGQTWGKRAEWVDYYGPLNGKSVGVAIFDHPDNPRHPTTWHVRDYGLFAANPFGLQSFEKKPKGAGAFRIEKGQEVRWAYLFVIHEGDTEEAGIAARYRKYKEEAAAKGGETHKGTIERGE